MGAKYRLGALVPPCFSFICSPVATKLVMMVLWDKRACGLNIGWGHLFPPFFSFICSPGTTKLEIMVLWHKRAWGLNIDWGHLFRPPPVFLLYLQSSYQQTWYDGALRQKSMGLNIGWGHLCPRVSALFVVRFPLNLV